MGKVFLILSMYGYVLPIELTWSKSLRNNGIKIIIDLHGAPGSQVRNLSGSALNADYCFVHHRTGSTTGR
jgi:hypothetical protein